MSNKTVRRIWDETPSGKAIKDLGYLAMCAFISDVFKLNIKEFGRIQPDIWNSTPEKVILLCKKLSKNTRFMEGIEEMNQARKL